MIELENLRTIWTGIDQKLDRNWKLNLKVIRQTNLNQVRRKMTQLIWVKGFTLAFYLLFTLLFAGFAVANWPIPHLVATGALFALWTLAVSVASIHELALVRSLDYAEPVTVLQKKLGQLRLTIISYLRLGVWVLPLNFGFIILFFKVLWGVDIVAVGDPAWMIGNIIFSIVVFVPLSLWLHRKLSPENAYKPWMNRVLGGNGSQITGALAFLKEIEKFERGEE
ncbi:MAG: hypothetical protein RIG62_15155 [Cyclobacteriaceae bacterium]